METERFLSGVLISGDGVFFPYKVTNMERETGKIWSGFIHFVAEITDRG